MSKAGSLRWNEDQLREYAAKRNRWGSFVPARADVRGVSRYCTHNPGQDPTHCAICNPERALTASLQSALPTKYRNVKTGGYASKREAKRAAELKLMVESGLIRDLREQVKFLLVPKQDGERACFYVADFVYVEPSPMEKYLGGPQTVVVEDCKGMRTPLYVLKRKLMQMVHNIKIKET